MVAPPQIVVVRHFDEELKRLVPLKCVKRRQQSAGQTCSRRAESAFDNSLTQLRALLRRQPHRLHARTCDAFVRADSLLLAGCAADAG